MHRQGISYLWAKRIENSYYEREGTIPILVYVTWCLRGEKGNGSVHRALRLIGMPPKETASGR